MSNQVTREDFKTIVRIIANRDTSVRYNPSAGGKPVLNLTAVRYFGGKDDEDPVFLDLALWGDIATRYKDSIEHNQICFVDSTVEYYLDEYNGVSKIKGKVSINNGYQFVLFPGTVRGERNTDGSAEASTQTPPASRSVAPQAQVNTDDIPF